MELSQLNTLLRRRGDFCEQMLVILVERMAESLEAAKALACGARANSAPVAHAYQKRLQFQHSPVA